MTRKQSIADAVIGSGMITAFMVFIVIVAV